MGFASWSWNVYSGDDLCQGIETGARIDHGTSGYVPTSQSGVASVFAIRI